MKKLLALVLALVMSMSLVTISNAAYADAADVDYSEAVDVLSKVGVFAGGDGNKFNPKEELTREQAAKIIAYLDLGEKTAEGLVGTNTFSDVPATRWSAGYIAYCAQAGYVSGIGNGKFDPQGKLTGLQFAKMLLCALGYDATKETLEGADWAINTAKLASTNDLFDKISKRGTEVLTREEAAQLALNALKADTYEYAIEGTTVKGDGFEVITGSSKASKVTTKKDYNNDGDNIQQLTEKLYGEDLKAKTVNQRDKFGRPATVWTYKAEEIGKFADSADYSFNAKVTEKVLYNTVGKTVVDDLNNAKKPDATLTVYVDGKTAGVSQDVAKYFDKNSTKSLGAGDYTGNGTTTEVYVNDDNNAVTIVIINTYVMQATSDYNAKKEEVKVVTPDNANNGGVTTDTLSLDDFAVITELKEDDYVLVTIADNEIQTVVPAKTVTGKVTAYSTENDVTIGGTTYKYNKTVKADKDNGKSVEFSIGDESTVVLDTNGFIIYVDEAKASSNQYLFSLKSAKKGDFDTDVILDAFFSDGTRKTITVKNDDVYTNGTDTTNKWFSYSEKKSGKFEITGVAAADLAQVTVTGIGKMLTENGKTAVGVDAATANQFKANKGTTFIVLDEDDNVKVYEGISKVPTIKVTAKSGDLTAFAKMDGSFAEYVFIDASDASVKGNTKSATDYVYLLKFDRAGTDADDNTYYQYKAIVNGEETTIKLDDTFGKKQTVMTLYDGIAYDADTGYVTDMDPVNPANGADDDYVKGDISGKEVNFSKGVFDFVQDKAVADNYNVYFVVEKNVAGINDNNNDYSVDTVTGSGLETECKDYKVTGTYFGVLNNDGEITNLYVYVSAATKA